MSPRSWIAVALTSALAGSAGAQTIVYPDFSNTAGLQLNGAAVADAAHLRLTPADYYQGGSAFSTTTVTLNSTASFSTFFSFQILGRGGLGNGADGLTFTVQTNANNVGGVGGGLGYEGIPHSVAVEFDTFDNGEPGGSNHVGFDVGGSVTSVTSVAEPVDFDDGRVWYAWVDYNGATQNLEARWSHSMIRPAVAGLAATLDLPTILGGTNVFAGFTAATGAGYGEHDILSWNFVNRFVAGGAPPPTTTTPEPATGAMLLAGLGVTGALARRRSMRARAMA